MESPDPNCKLLSPKRKARMSERLVPWQSSGVIFFDPCDKVFILGLTVAPYGSRGAVSVAGAWLMEL